MADSFGFCKHQLSLEVACRSPAPRQKARPSFSRSRRRNWLPQKIMGFNRKNGPKSEGFGVPVLGNHHFEIAQLLRKKHRSHWSGFRDHLLEIVQTSPGWCSPVRWGPPINFGAPPHLKLSFNKVLGGPPLQRLATPHAHVPPPIKKGPPSKFSVP